MLRASLKYIDDIVQLMNMGKSKTVTTPSLLKDPPEDSPLLNEEETTRFKSAVGTALYVTPDREDIQRDVQLLARAMKAPTDFDWKRLVRLVCYLKGTRTLGILMKKPKGEPGIVKLDMYSAPTLRTAERREGL